MRTEPSPFLRRGLRGFARVGIAALVLCSPAICAAQTTGGPEFWLNAPGSGPDYEHAVAKSPGGEFIVV